MKFIGRIVCAFKGHAFVDVPGSLPACSRCKALDIFEPMWKTSIAAYTHEEGGSWLPFPFVARVYLDELNLDGVREACAESGARVGMLRGMTVHALRFDNGAEWDVVNGWRS